MVEMCAILSASQPAERKLRPRLAFPALHSSRFNPERSAAPLSCGRALALHSQ